MKIMTETIRHSLVGILMCVLGGSLAWAQTQAPAQTETPAQTEAPAPQRVKQAPPSLPHLYWHFLIYQNHLDQEAAKREEQGEDGSWLRDRFQKELGFTDDEFAKVRAAAQHLEPELKLLDRRAKAVADAFREEYRAALAEPPGSSTPPVPPELHALQRQREELIQSEITNLKTALGPQLSARLDTFLTSRLAPADIITGHPSPNAQAHHERAVQKTTEPQQ